MEVSKQADPNNALKKRGMFKNNKGISLTGWDKMEKKKSDSRSLSVSRLESQISADSNNSKASYLESQRKLQLKSQISIHEPNSLLGNKLFKLYKSTKHLQKSDSHSFNEN